MGKYIMYTYQFQPLLKKQGELDLFMSTADVDKVMSEKQDIFSSLFKNGSILINCRGKTYANEVCYDHQGKIILRVASNHLFSRASNFKKQKMTHNPWNTVIIDNRKDIQILYIEDVSESFRDTDTLANLLSSSFNKLLFQYNLQMHIDRIYESVSFWEFVDKHRDNIARVNLTYSYPNLPRLAFQGDEMIRHICYLVHGNEMISIFANKDESLLLYKGLDPYLDTAVERASENGIPIEIVLRGSRTKYKVGVDRPCIVMFPYNIISQSSEKILFDDDDLNSLTILLDKYYDDRTFTQTKNS